MSNIPGAPVGYTDLLRDHLYEKSKKELESKRASGGDKNPLRPSSAGKCERELAYELMEHSQQGYWEKQPLDPETSLLFGLGHSVEYHLLQQFKNVELLRVGYQQQSLLFFPITSPNPRINTFIEGSIDAGFMGVNHDWKCLIDVKSKKVKHSQAYKDSWDEQFDKLSNMKTVIKIPDSQDAWWVENAEAFIEELNDAFMAQNLWQLNFYAHADFIKHKGFDHCALLYYSKNDSRLRELRFKPNASLYEKVRNRFQRAADAATAGDPMLAFAEYALGSVKCAFCSYKEACHGSEANALKEFFKQLPAKKWPTDLDRLPSEIQSQFNLYHNGLPMIDEQEELKTKIMKYMYDNRVFKVQLQRGGPVYELKTYKNHMDLKRSKA